MKQVALAKREKQAVAKTIDAQSVVAEWLANIGRKHPQGLRSGLA